MKIFIEKIVLWCVKILFKVRYRITYKGLDKVQEAMKEHSHGALFLPNHPCIFTDPLIIAFPILAKYRARPLVTEYMFFDPLLNWVMHFIQALPIPNFVTGINPLKLSRLEKTLKVVDEGLRKGETFLIYPAGMTKPNAREILGGTYAVPNLIAANPDVVVILVRTTGLWGSRFSRAYTKGRQVNLFVMLKRSIKDIVKNFIFFVPKRNVLVEFEVATQDFPRKASKLIMNRYLEKWYNKPFENMEFGGEPLTIVPYSIWGGEIPHVEKKVNENLVGKEIPKEVEEEVFKKLAELAQVPVEQITPEKYLTADLSIDSLNIAELITFLETRYETRNIDPQSLGTVAHVLLAATHRLEKAKIPEIDWDTAAWEKSRKQEQLFIGKGETIPDVFLSKADKNLFKIAASDPLNGPVSYHFLKSRILLLIHVIEKLPGKHVGILLPASIGVNILIYACHLAGKVPVMINWTVGGRHLESVVALSELKSVLTSWTFLDRLDNVDLSPIQDMLVVLEELRATFSWWKIATSPLKACVPSWILKRLGLLGAYSSLSPHSDAVVLFTSGTEKMPKGVPLTHANILENLKSTLQAVEFFSQDRILSSLPPFHSFGFSLTGLWPLLIGLRTVFSPNPADAGMQIRALIKWKPTIICSAPSFLLHILRQGRSIPFTQVRMVVSGAERPSEELFSLVKEVVPNAILFEGYGITECSPVLTINSTGDRSMGVGRPVSKVSLMIVHPDDFSQRFTSGESGMVLASGPNIFKGYLQKDEKSPFYVVDGITWYVTGDIGYLNEKGALTITGRLKRFIKIGGEMISLLAVESVLLEEFSEGDVVDGPRLALCAQEMKEGRPRLILFLTKEKSLFEVNTLLRTKGFSSLVRIDRIVVLEEIPLTGTGKIAYRQLEEMVTT